MAQNIGLVDRYVRLFIGLTLLSLAFKNGLSIHGWRWLGLIGLVFLITALLQRCPAYVLFGTSTLERFAPQNTRTDAPSGIDDHVARS